MVNDFNAFGYLRSSLISFHGDFATFFMGLRDSVCYLFKRLKRVFATIKFPLK